jgi:malonyl-CoA O-methyltransferase
MLSERKYIRRSFSNAASSYNLAAFHQKSIAEKVVENYKNFYTKDNLNNCVVDIGSGTGFVSNECFRQGLFDSMICLDISEAMLNQDREYKNKKSKLCADLHALPFQKESLDVCLSSYAFQWTNNYEKLFSELYRVLKPGGIVFFSTPGPNTFNELKQAWAHADNIRKVTDNTSKVQHVNDFISDKKILQIASECGFKELHHAMQTDVLAYSEQKHALEHIKNIGASNLNQQRRKNLLGKQHYVDFSQAFKKHSSSLENYTLTYESYFFGFLKPI